VDSDNPEVKYRFSIDRNCCFVACSDLGGGMYTSI